MGSLFSSLLCASAGPQSVLRVTRGRNPTTIKREGVNIKCATAATASLWNDVATKFASSHGIQVGFKIIYCPEKEMLIQFLPLSLLSSI